MQKAPNKSLQPTPLRGAAELERVRRAWRVTSKVKVLWPGFRRAEGKKKGKGVVARRCMKEAQSEAAGR
jgi:hypothetical protein